MVELGILGPLVVRVGGADVAIGPGLQRSLLTRLLIEVNRVVTPDRLIADLGPATAPAASPVLRTAVSRLRRLLGPERLVTVPEGHLLVVRPGELDVARFSALLAQARLPTMSPADTVALLTEAEGLWRGPALGDLADRPWARATVARLDRQRHEATVARLDAQLTIGGRTDAVADEAESLLSRWPHDPALRELMTRARAQSPRPEPEPHRPRPAEARAAHRPARRPRQLGHDPLGRPLRR